MRHPPSPGALSEALGHAGGLRRAAKDTELALASRLPLLSFAVSVKIVNAARFSGIGPACDIVKPGGREPIASGHLSSVGVPSRPIAVPVRARGHRQDGVAGQLKALLSCPME